jgi:hypothetical protein
MASTAQGKMSIRRQLKRRYAPAFFQKLQACLGWHVWVAGVLATMVEGRVSRARRERIDIATLKWKQVSSCSLRPNGGRNYAGTYS